jgi:uncharacterized membrane protein
MTSIASLPEPSPQSAMASNRRVAPAPGRPSMPRPMALALWIGINSWIIRSGAFDPFPHILLNLVLSCIAAIQAPIIMMSQNRSATRDRLQAEENFKINLKAELEVAALHEKIDHLLHGQYERIMEAHAPQFELLQGLAVRAERDRG